MRPRPLRHEIVVDAARLRELATSWRALGARAVAPSPTKTPTWLLAWWRQFGTRQGRRLATLAVFDDRGALVAIVPLCALRRTHRGLLPMRRLELVGTGEPEADEICSDYVGATVAEGWVDEAAMVTARVLGEGALGGFDALVMPSMDHDDPFVHALRSALVEVGISAEVTTSHACMHVPLPASFDAYLHALDRDRRYLVTRALRELSQWAGPSGWNLTVARTPRELAEAREILRALHGERWQHARDGGVFGSPTFSAFHDEVMSGLASGSPDGDGRLDLWWLAVHGKPIAALYNVVHRGKVHFYQSGRALEVPKQLKIGIAMHALVMQRAIEEGLTDYDFLAGDAQYKRQLGLAQAQLCTLDAIGPSPRARVVDRSRAAIDQAWATTRTAVRALAERIDNDTMHRLPPRLAQLLAPKPSAPRRDD